jgi:hypothetical protein
VMSGRRWDASLTAGAAGIVAATGGAATCKGPASAARFGGGSSDVAVPLEYYSLQ